MQTTCWILLTLSLSAALPVRGAFAGEGDFHGRIRANDAPVGGRFTVNAYFLDTLDVAFSRPGPGRMLLLSFNDSNGKDAFVVPGDLELRGESHTSQRGGGLVPLKGKRVGGFLKKDETRWALWWVPSSEEVLNWQSAADLRLHYGFSKTVFVPFHGNDRKELARVLPWADLKSVAVFDSAQVGDQSAIDAASFDQPPVVKFRRDPRYPRSAKLYDFQGSLYVAVQVNAKGNVEDAYILQSNATHDLNVAALIAVMEWTFRPGLKSGKVVGGDIVIPIEFDLGSVK